MDIIKINCSGSRSVASAQRSKQRVQRAERENPSRCLRSLFNVEFDIWSQNFKEWQVISTSRHSNVINSCWVFSFIEWRMKISGGNNEKCDGLGCLCWLLSVRFISTFYDCRVKIDLPNPIFPEMISSRFFICEDVFL